MGKWHAVVTNRFGDVIPDSEEEERGDRVGFANDVEGVVRVTGDFLGDRQPIEHRCPDCAGRRKVVALLPGMRPEDHPDLAPCPTCGSQPANVVAVPRLARRMTAAERESRRNVRKIKTMSDAEFDVYWDKLSDAVARQRPRQGPTVAQQVKKALGKRSIDDLSDEEFDRLYRRYVR